jgi:protein tyrosine/serine phosphatase
VVQTTTATAGQTEETPPNRRGRFTRRWFLATAAVAVVGTTGFVTWQEVLKDRFLAKRFGVVVPGQVFRSGQISDAMLEPTLRENGIRAIVDLNGIEPGLPGQAREIELAAQMGIELYRFPLGGDGTGDIRNYARAIGTIERCRREGKPVLVHCAAGTQRTGGVVACFRMLVLGHSPQDAVAELRSYDWEPDDDELLTFVNSHMAELAELLAADGIIPQVPATLPKLTL